MKRSESFPQRGAQAPKVEPLPPRAWVVQANVFQEWPVGGLAGARYGDRVSSQWDAQILFDAQVKDAVPKI